MANVMAIFQDVDKCVRCNGCVISCKRTWDMKAENPGVLKVAPDTRVIIKSQKRLDMGPFIRFSCWHCPSPPCAGRCPFDAIVKQPNGAVSVDPALCDPLNCQQECVNDCERGGYPKPGVGSDRYTTPDAWKCTLCHGRAGDIAGLDAATQAQYLAKYGNPLPANDGHVNNIAGSATVAEMAHEPSCVYTCPAKAMKWDTREVIWNYIGSSVDANGDPYISYQGDGSMFWASRKYIIAAPKADPFVEDHIAPMLSSVLTDSVSKATLVPTLVAGGVLAAIARKIHLANEAATDGKG